MLKLFIVALAVAAVVADLDSDWAVFKDKYAKKYSSDEVEKIRKSLWVDNMEMIERHNKLYEQGISTYYLGENEFADMNHNEFVAEMNGMKVKVEYQPDKYFIKNMSLPTTVDWRTKGYVTGIKNQGQCGSCWAFSATGSMEGQHFKKTGKLVSLSESNLVDCSDAFGNNGCDGGLMDNAFEYVMSNKGIDTEASYPYKPEDRPCHFRRSNVGATISSYKDVSPAQSEAALQQVTATIGPISVAIDASEQSFQFYEGGVYNNPACSSTQLDHGVLVVGYGTFQSRDYWMVKNSWGTSWGIQGYIMMTRNDHNQCGIATMASYPIV